MLWEEIAEACELEPDIELAAPLPIWMYSNSPSSSLPQFSNLYPGQNWLHWSIDTIELGPLLEHQQFRFCRIAYSYPSQCCEHKRWLWYVSLYAPEELPEFPDEQ